MSFQLRPYQESDLGKIRRALKVHRRVLYQCPTGGGKTVIAGAMLHGVERTKKRALFVCHREELIEQTAITLEGADIDHGFCASGYRPDYTRPVTLCSVATLGNRLAKMPPPDLIVFDEAHHMAAGTWKRIADAWPNIWHVGLSATPQRLDGKGLDKAFSALVPGPPIKWLIEQGYLTDYRLFTHPAPNLDKIKRRGQDLDLDEMAEAFSGKLLGDAVEHYNRICPGALFVVFDCNIKQAIECRDAFIAAGIPTEQLDGDSERGFRRRTVADFRHGNIRGLTAVDLFGEGFDLPQLACAILRRRTLSLSLALQWVGRALRPVYAKGYDLYTQAGRLAAIAAGPKPISYIIDHGGNFGPAGLHGMPCDHREWTLAGRGSAKSGATPTKVCPQCFGVSGIGLTHCPYCTHEFELTPREIEIIEGQLEEAKRDEVRAAVAAQPVYEAEGFEAIFDIAMARQHKKPWHYAAGIMRSRGKAVTEDQYRWALKQFAEAKGYKPGWIHQQMQFVHIMRAETAA